MNEIITKWDEVLELAESRLMHTAFEKWIRPLQLIHYDEEINTLYLDNPNSQTDYSQTRYLPLLEETVSDVFKKDVNLYFLTDSTEDNILRQSFLNQNTDENLSDLPFYGNEDLSIQKSSQLNDKYTFDTFIVSDNNEMAHAACQAVATRPVSGTSNPLFIYGNSGLGKTHLMHAIGHEVLKNHPEKKVVYVSSEMFTNDLIYSLQRQNMEDFRARYRNIDYLLIDDIQFIEKKERTQEEMFHTFEQLYHNHKQIVFTSDRPPRDISNISQRLRSRFEWGLTVDIFEPDLETRVAILRKKAAMLGTTLNTRSEEDLQAIFFMIAENITNNIRELEGALNQLVAAAEFQNRKLDKNSAYEILSRSFDINRKAVDIPLIKQIVCSHFGITIQQIDSSKRTKDLIYPRQIAMYLSREITEESFPKIGSSFGNKDHTTVIHACSKIEKDIKTDEELQKTIDELRSRILEQ